jgi:cytochrome c oxidase cbb3-type subunit 3
MNAPRDDEDRLLGHEYDGIQEYDNPLPGWWRLLLWGTIVWGVLYFFNVVPGIGSGKGRIAAYEADSAAAAAKQPPANASLDVGLMLADLKDPAEVAAGKAIFEDPSKCASCHQADGGGLVGPNLTDDYWIHGPRPADILKTITEGVPDKGMLTWGPILGPKKVAEVAAYVYTLHGRHVATPKEPQGTKYSYGPDGPITTAAPDSSGS